ncbi:MAG: hypothetical protein RLZZ262_456, partial [Bacteroidota bacterium]
MNLAILKLKQFWESLQVTPGMRWFVWGVYGWHVLSTL